jgi:uncharacterized protein YraI
MTKILLPMTAALLLLALGFLPMPSIASETPRTAWVVSVDRPENCLRVRGGPGTSYPIVGCVNWGQKLRLTGLWSGGKWTQIDRPAQGWLTASQITTSAVAYEDAPDVPPRAVTYVEQTRVVPTYVYSDPVYVRPYRYPRYQRGYGYRPYNYGGPGVSVRVGPYGGVGVRAGGVAVGVGPRGRWGVRVR